MSERYSGGSDDWMKSERTQGNVSCCQTDYECCTTEKDTRAMDILSEMKKLHEERLQRIEREAGGECPELKEKVLKSWVTDLEEQNTMLVQVLGKLEQEAAERVTLLKEKLETSAAATSRFIESEQDREKVISQLTEENQQLQNTIVQFFNQHQEFQAHIAAQYEQHLGKVNVTTQKLQSTSTNDLDESIKSLISCFDEVLQERQQLVQEVETLKSELASKDIEIEDLHNKVLIMDESARDMREALAVEVADKHDQIISLRREIHHLEDRCRQADMQTHFKDDIIKEMRKDLKTAKSRLEGKLIPLSPSCRKEACVGTDDLTITVSESGSSSKMSVKEIYNYRHSIKPQEGTARKPRDDMKDPPRLHTEAIEMQLLDLRREFDNSSASEEDSLAALQVKLKSAQNLVKSLKDKAQSHVENLKMVEQNQADSERRIRELKSILEMSQHQVRAALDRVSEVDMAVPYIQEVQKYNEGSQEALKNMRAEIHFMLFNLRSHSEKSCYFEESISSLELALEQLQESLMDIQSMMGVNTNVRFNLQLQDMGQYVQGTRMLEDGYNSAEEDLSRYTNTIISAVHAHSAPNPRSRKHSEEHKNKDKEDEMVYQEQRIQGLEQEIASLQRKVADYDILQETFFRMKSEFESVKFSLDAKEQIVKDQEEMISILQDSVNTAEKEQVEILSRLASLENEKEKALSELEEVEKRAENLQEALLGTKKQLEELEGSKFEVSVSSWGWPHSNRNASRHSVHDV